MRTPVVGRHPVRCVPLACLLLAALTLPALPVRAAGVTYTVTSLGDSGAGSGLTGDLRYALTQVNTGTGGDTITFAVTGTIVLTGTLPVIAKDVTITGPGADHLTIDGKQRTRVLTISPNRPNDQIRFAMSGLTITGGQTGEGGGILMGGYAGRLTDCVVADNVAAGAGGGISVYGGQLTIERSVIRGNSAVAGGAITRSFGR